MDGMSSFQASADRDGRHYLRSCSFRILFGSCTKTVENLLLHRGQLPAKYELKYLLGGHISGS